MCLHGDSKPSHGDNSLKLPVTAACGEGLRCCCRSRAIQASCPVHADLQKTAQSRYTATCKQLYRDEQAPPGGDRATHRSYWG